MFTSLMTTRRFAPLFLCQFFAAFGDNFLKQALIFVILYQVVGANSEALITLAGATFIAPFFFLSGLGGELADRYDKALVAQRIKLVEIGAAVLAVVGFAFQSLIILFVALFLFGTLASLFGPIKYGILPDHLAREELPGGNALIEGGTFLAILLGTIVAGIAANGDSNPIHFAWLMILTALASWLASLLHPADRRGRARSRDQPQHPRLDRLADQTAARRSAAVVGRHRGELVLARWRAGAVAAPPLVTVNIGGTDGRDHGVLDHLLGRGRGRLRPGRVAGRRSHRHPADAHRRRAARPVLARSRLDGVRRCPSGDPLGIAAFFASPHSIRIAIDLAGLAIAGGLFVVPTFAAVQAWAGADRRARVVAGVNVLNAAFMVVGAIVQPSCRPSASACRSCS